VGYAERKNRLRIEGHAYDDGYRAGYEQCLANLTSVFSNAKDRTEALALIDQYLVERARDRSLAPDALEMTDGSRVEV